jgi:hypothetical protein
MAAAFGWGTLAGSSLVIGAIIALLCRMSLRVIGLIMGFGAGVLWRIPIRLAASHTRCAGSALRDRVGIRWRAEHALAYVLAARCAFAEFPDEIHQTVIERPELAREPKA